MLMSDVAQQMLKQHKLPITEARIFILNLFITYEQPLSYIFIKKKLNERTTRITLFRTLKTLLNKKIIQGTLNENGVRTNSMHYSKEEKQTTRLQCKECGGIYDVSLPLSNIFKKSKYIVENVEILLKGICEKCNSSNTTSN